VMERQTIFVTTHQDRRDAAAERSDARSAAFVAGRQIIEAATARQALELSNDPYDEDGAW